MCNRAGYLPVMSAARVGEHTVQAEYACVKRIPSRASRSMLGVWYNFDPWQPKSVQPRSSTRTKTMFGFGPLHAAGENPAAKHHRPKARELVRVILVLTVAQARLPAFDGLNDLLCQADKLVREDRIGLGNLRPHFVDKRPEG